MKRMVVALLTAAAMAFAVVLSAPSTNNVGQQRRNILLLITDDQDVVLGGADHMPFLRQHLMQQGATFQNFFVHTPVCCPSRASIFSGRYLHNIGLINNSVEGNCYGPAWQSQVENNYTFAVYAQQSGYRTGYAGKYLNTYGLRVTGGSRVPPGWEKWLAIVGNSAYYNYTTVTSDNGGANVTRDKHGQSYKRDYFSNLVANRTLEMIRDFTNESDHQPFLIVTAWPAPHDDIIPAPWAVGRFKGLKAPRTPNWNTSDEFQQNKHWLLRQLVPINLNTELFIDRVHQARLETLLSVDRHIDQFVRLLKKRGVLNNTIIMYTSDNGFQLGQHRLKHEKYHMYEHDIRVPFVVRGPSIPKNTSVLDIALNIDIAPTIYELINNGISNTSTALPETMDGISFLPIHQEGTPQRRQDFLVSYHGQGIRSCGLEFCPDPPPRGKFHSKDSFNNTYHCVRSIILSNNTDFVFCRFVDDENFVEYYNLTADPWQLYNNASDLSDGQFSAMDARLAALRACSGGECRAPWSYKPVAAVEQPKTSSASERMSLKLWIPLAHVLFGSMILVLMKC